MAKKRNLPKPVTQADAPIQSSDKYYKANSRRSVLFQLGRVDGAGRSRRAHPIRTPRIVDPHVTVAESNTITSADKYYVEKEEQPLRRPPRPVKPVPHVEPKAAVLPVEIPAAIPTLDDPEQFAPVAETLHKVELSDRKVETPAIPVTLPAELDAQDSTVVPVTEDAKKKSKPSKSARRRAAQAQFADDEAFME